MNAMRITKRFLMLSVAGILVPACSTVNSVVPDNMQFWNSTGAQNSSSPRLADTPSPDAIKKVRDDVDLLRKNLEEDRDRARRIAMGIPIPFESPEAAEQSALPEVNTAILTQTQQAMWLRLNGVNKGLTPLNDGKKVSEAELPPEMFVPDNVAINYEVAPTAQYQPMLYSSQAVEYVGADDNVKTLPLEAYEYTGRVQLTPLDSTGTTPNTNTSPSGTPDGVIFFDYGSKELTDADKDFIRELAGEAKPVNGIIKLIGHASQKVDTTDPAAAKAANLRISDKRAIAVMHEFVANGIPESRIEMIAQGDNVPMWEIEGKTPEEADRRVEIFFGDFNAETAKSN